MSIAHKGASDTFFDNTLLFLEKTLEMGTDILEIDLMTSKDGDFVAFHDDQARLGNTGR